MVHSGEQGRCPQRGSIPCVCLLSCHYAVPRTPQAARLSATFAGIAPCLGDRFALTLGSMKILAISGSLRAASINSALLRAVSRLAPAGIVVEPFGDLGKLPLFNPDIEATDPPFVARLRAQIIAADAVVIASPEYAHGVTGPLKNALDWMVGCEAFVNKPVVLLNASPRAVHAQASLKETITVMSAIIVEKSSITVPILGSGLDEEGIIAHVDISRQLIESLRSLDDAVCQLRQAGAIT